MTALAPLRPGPDPGGSGESGAAILEFALALPILLALVAGSFELGRTLLVRQTMIGAARAGARVLARIPDPVCEERCSPGAAAALALVREQVAGSRLRPGEVLSVTSEWGPERRTVAVRAAARLQADLLPWVGLGRVARVEVVHREPWIGP